MISSRRRDYGCRKRAEEIRLNRAPAGDRQPSEERIMYEDLALYIDGEFIHGDGRREQPVYDPATGEVIANLPHATRADLDRALAATQRAFESWKSVSPMEKSRILRKAGEMIRERAKAIGHNIT